MYVLLFITSKIRFFATVIMLSLFDDANILPYRNISLNIARYYRYIDII